MLVLCGQSDLSWRSVVSQRRAEGDVSRPAGCLWFGFVLFFFLLTSGVRRRIGRDDWAEEVQFWASVP